MSWLLPILAYLVGSIPFGVLIARSRGVDIRQHGSGNVGATNVFRVVGKSFGITCLLLDFLKGFLPVILATNLLRIAGETPAVPLDFLQNLTGELPADQRLHVHSIQVITALAAIMGHNYSIFLRGKGGKGIATSAGVLVALMPLVLLAALIVFSATFYYSGYVSLGSIAGAVSIPILYLWRAGTWNKPLLVFTLVAAALAIWRHRSNIQRILAGTEDRLACRTKKSSRAGPDHDQKGDDHGS